MHYLLARKRLTPWNPNDPSDAALLVPAGSSRGDRHQGYTYLEFYLNELADSKLP